MFCGSYRLALAAQTKKNHNTYQIETYVVRCCPTLANKLSLPVVNVRSSGILLGEAIAVAHLLDITYAANPVQCPDWTNNCGLIGSDWL